jgi:outer membrane protein assembly factor BamB
MIRQNCKSLVGVLRSPWRWRWAMCLSLLCGIAVIAPRGADAAERDSIEGKWIGMAGTEKERIEIGLEFKRDDNGALKVILTQPISNYFGVDPGGEATLRGNTVKHDALALSLTLRGDHLEGTLPGPSSPAQLHRTDTLPRETSPPKVTMGAAPLWQTRLGGQAYATPTLADGVAYIGSTGGVFQAVNISDGSLRWAFSAGRPIYAQAALADAAVYFVCDNGWLFKLAQADGKEIWRYALGDAEVSRVTAHPAVFDWDWQAARPLIVDGVVYAGSGDGGMHAVDAQSGTRRWRFDTRGRIRHGAAVDGERIVFGSYDHFVYALERSSGKEVWRFDSGAEVDTTPVIHAGKVLFGNRGSGLFSLDVATGMQLWRLYFWGSWVESTPIVMADTIYIGSSDLRRVSAIDVATGTVRWRSDVFGWTFGTPLIDGDRIHVGAAGGTPYFVRHLASYTTLDRGSGKILSRRPLPDTGGHQWGIAGSLQRAGDTLIFATIEGSLFAYPIRVP